MKRCSREIRIFLLKCWMMGHNLMILKPFMLFSHKCPHALTHFYNIFMLQTEQDSFVAWNNPRITANFIYWLVTVGSNNWILAWEAGMLSEKKKKKKRFFVSVIISTSHVYFSFISALIILRVVGLLVHWKKKRLFWLTGVLIPGWFEMAVFFPYWTSNYR